MWSLGEIPGRKKTAIDRGELWQIKRNSTGLDKQIYHFKKLRPLGIRVSNGQYAY